MILNLAAMPVTRERRCISDSEFFFIYTIRRALVKRGDLFQIFAGDILTSSLVVESNTQLNNVLNFS